MQVNRYTNIQPAKYTPRTLQELMMVPQYKREQHTGIEDQIAATETALAQMDPLDIHSERARMEQQKLYDQMTQQAEKLGSEGFTQTSKSDFGRLNKQYQQAISPTGDLGKIQGAKKAMATKRESYIANATKLGYSPEDIALNWKDEEAKYAKQFEETGEITDIEDRYSPNFHDPKSELMDLFSKAGVEGSDLSTLTSSIITKDPRGQYVLTRGAKDKYSSNVKNLEAAVDYMNKQVLNPNSDVHRSLVEQRKDPNTVLQELEGLNKVFEKTTTDTSTTSQVSSFSPTKNGTNNGMGITLSNKQYAPTKYSSLSYSQIEDKIYNLETTKNLTTEQKAELNELSTFKLNLHNKLKNNKGYSDLYNKVQTLEDELQSKQNGTYNYTNDLRITPGLDPTINTAETIQKFKEADLTSTVNELSKAQSNLDEFIKPSMEEEVLVTSNYKLTPYTPKQEGILKLLNRNIGDLFQSTPENILNTTDITSMELDGNLYKGITPDDKDGIATLLYNAKKDNVELIDFTPKGSNGKPQYTIRINTTKDNKYDMDGIGKGDIGGGKPVTLTVSFDQISDEFASNVNGLVEQFVAQGGGQGKDLAAAMEINRTKFNLKGRTWGELNKVNLSNPTVIKILDQKLKNKGISAKSTEEEYNLALASLQNEVID